MATYSTSQRLKRAYKDCRGYYGGMGPVDRVPTRFQVAVTMPHRFTCGGREINMTQISVHLTVVNSRRDPKRLKYWHGVR